MACAFSLNGSTTTKDRFDPAVRAVLSDSIANTTRLVGVLGGMGPLATVDFLQKIIAVTLAQSDQDHVPVVVSNIPQIPDRANAYLTGSTSPLAAMLECGRRLVAAGANLIVMPCNTAHLWFDELRSGLKVEMLHIVDTALEDALNYSGPGVRIGLLATEATLASCLYKKRLSTFGDCTVEWVLPAQIEIRHLIMPGIAAVKASDLVLGTRLLSSAARALTDRGATILILGCTEIPLVLNQHLVRVPIIDPTVSLARRVVSWARAN